MWHKLRHWFGWYDVQVVGFFDGERTVILCVCKECGRVLD
jgi:hypothetical protein